MLLRTLGDIPIECNMKSSFPPWASIAFCIRFSRSGVDVASAAITIALQRFANSLILPMRKAIGALDNVISAPCATTANAVFQAMERSSSAPNMIPFFPFSNWCDISISCLQRVNIVKQWRQFENQTRVVPKFHYAATI